MPKSLDTKMTQADWLFLGEAFAEAKVGYQQGGVPVGAVMVKNGEVIARGRNKRVQENDPVMHGETDCLRNAGLQESYQDVDLYTTLSPCMMCTGAILHFGIRRVVVGENVNFEGNLDVLNDYEVVTVLADDAQCKGLMAQFIQERPDIWFEDIAGREHT